MTISLQLEGRRSVKLQADVDRTLARRLDAAAQQYGTTRAAVIRAALYQALPVDQG